MTPYLEEIDSPLRYIYAQLLKILKNEYTCNIPFLKYFTVIKKQTNKQTNN